MQLIDFFRNRILFGDCLEMLRQIPDNSVQMVVTSPPYFNLREYYIEGQLGWETTPEEFVHNLVMVFHEIKRILRPDGVCFLNIGDTYWGSNGFDRATNGWHRKGRSGAPKNDRKLPKHKSLKVKDLCLVPERLSIALQEDGWYVRNDIIWSKPNPMPFPVTDRVVNSHEYIFYMTKSARPFYDAYAVKEPVADSSIIGGKRNRRDVWFSDTDEKMSAAQWMLMRLGIEDPELFDILLEDYESNHVDKTDVWRVTAKGTKEIHFATYPEDLIKPAILAGTSEHGACPTCGAPYKRVIERGEPIKEWKAKCGADANGGYNGKSEKFLKQDALGKATQMGFNARWKAKQQNASDVKRRILEGMVEQKTVSWEPTCDCYKYKQQRIDSGQTMQSFVRDNKTEKIRAKSREDAVKLYPDDPEKQKEYIRFVHDHSCVIPEETVAWQKTCDCEEKPPVPCIVLDPFMGSGTTAVVAKKLGRDFIGIDLSKDYIEIAERRIKAVEEQIAEKKKKEETNQLKKKSRFEDIEPMEK